jgi:hypothetical protein
LTGKANVLGWKEEGRRRRGKNVKPISGSLLPTQLASLREMKEGRKKERES